MSVEYVLKTDGDGEPVFCTCCGMVAPVYAFSRAHMDPKDPARYDECEFCSTTMTSNYLRLSDLGDAEYLRSQVWLAAACSYNMMAAKLTTGVELALAPSPFKTGVFCRCDSCAASEGVHIKSALVEIWEQQPILLRIILLLLVGLEVVFSYLGLSSLT